MLIKKIVLSILLYVIVLGCSKVEPIIQDVCEITDEICKYANLICSEFNPDMDIKEQEKIKSELINIKQLLQSRVDKLSSDKRYKDYIYNINQSINKLNKKIEGT